MTAPLALEEAQQRLLALAKRLGSEEIPIAEAHGRHLTCDLVANRSQPAADMSAMDGFAVAGYGPWRVVGESRAGHSYDGAIQSGEATRISTGALMPSGADRVLIVENAKIDGERLSAKTDPAPGEYIRRKGFDFASGASLLPAGTLLRAPQLALAFAAGAARLPVAKQPRLAILDCGDELVSNPANCPAHQLPASNGAMLAALAAPLAASIERIGPVPDRLEALTKALDTDADVIVTSGGVSVGEHDLIRPALERLGYRLDFWRVAIKPGKPLLVAERDGGIVLGLPGNPVSAYVTAYLFLLPLLRAMAGASEVLPRPLALPLGANLPVGGPRREFLRARIEDGQAVAWSERDSSALLTLARSSILIDRPAEAPAVKRGTPVPCYWLENGGIA